MVTMSELKAWNGKINAGLAAQNAFTDAFVKNRGSSFDDVPLSAEEHKALTDGKTNAWFSAVPKNAPGNEIGVSDNPTDPRNIALNLSALESGQVGVDDPAISMSNQVDKTGTDTTSSKKISSDPKDWIVEAYAAIGRNGIGTQPNQIDQAGYDHWLSEIQTGAMTAEDFANAFAGTVSGYLAENPDDPVSKYVKDYIVTDAYKKIGRSGFGDQPNQIDQAGYDYWYNQLGLGPNAYEDFGSKFKGSTESYLNDPATSNDPVSNYVRGFSKNGGSVTPGVVDQPKPWEAKPFEAATIQKDETNYIPEIPLRTDKQYINPAIQNKNEYSVPKWGGGLLSANQGNGLLSPRRY